MARRPDTAPAAAAAKGRGPWAEGPAGVLAAIGACLLGAGALLLLLYVIVAQGSGRGALVYAGYGFLAVLLAVPVLAAGTLAAGLGRGRIGRPSLVACAVLFAVAVAGAAFSLRNASLPAWAIGLDLGTGLAGLVGAALAWKREGPASAPPSAPP